MMFAKLYRKDLVTGDYSQPVGAPCVLRGSAPHMHLFATQAAKRAGAQAYQLWQGDTFAKAKPISLMHDVQGR